MRLTKTLVADARVVAPHICISKRTSNGGIPQLILFVCLLLFNESCNPTSENEMAKKLFNRFLSGIIENGGCP